MFLQAIQENAIELPKMLKPVPFRVETLIGTMYPDLRSRCSGGPAESGAAVREGVARLDELARRAVGRAIPGASGLAADALQQFVNEVIERRLLDRYDPGQGPPEAFFGVVLRRVARRIVRKHFRAGARRVEATPEPASAAAGPLDDLIYAEMLDVARNAYLTLGGKQRRAVRKIYPFLDAGDVGGAADPRTERMDRHRGMKVIRSAISRYRDA